MDLEHKAEILISECKDFINTIERDNLTNEQWFIKFEDALNELSVKDHLTVERN